MNTGVLKKTSAPLERDEQLSTAQLIHRVRQDLARDWLQSDPSDPESRFHSMGATTTVQPYAPKKSICGMPVFDLSWMAAMTLMASYVSTPGAHAQISFLNANNLNIMMKDAAYRDILRGQIVLADGIGIDLAARILDGRPFVANLNGTDFLPALMTFLAEPLRIGLIGGRPGVLAGAVANFRKHAPWHQFVPIADGYFDQDELPILLDRLADAELDILLVGMGTPLQEKWIADHIKPHHARLVFGVGALFDFVSGTVERAPAWMRRIRCEWLYRLAREPGRLWRRYVLGIPVFLFHVFRFKLRHQPVPVEVSLLD